MLTWLAFGMFCLIACEIVGALLHRVLRGNELLFVGPEQSTEGDHENAR